MNYIAYAFGTFFNVMNNIIIPFPVSDTLVFKFSVFNLFIGLLVISSIIFALQRYLNIFTFIGMRDSANVLYETSGIKSINENLSAKSGKFIYKTGLKIKNSVDKLNNNPKKG